MTLMPGANWAIFSGTRALLNHHFDDVDRCVDHVVVRVAVTLELILFHLRLVGVHAVGQHVLAARLIDVGDGLANIPDALLMLLLSSAFVVCLRLQTWLPVIVRFTPGTHGSAAITS